MVTSDLNERHISCEAVEAIRHVMFSGETDGVHVSEHHVSSEAVEAMARHVQGGNVT